MDSIWRRQPSTRLTTSSLINQGRGSAISAVTNKFFKYTFKQTLLPTTVFTDATVGAIDWDNQTSIFAEDSYYSMADYNSVWLGGGRNYDSYYLVVKDFGFQIPPGAIIEGITLEIARYAEMFNVIDNIVTLYQDFGGKKNPFDGSDNKAKPDIWSDGNLTYVTYGNENDLWGNPTFNADDLNSSGFGIAFSVSLNPTSLRNTPIAYIDFMRVTVTYSLFAFSDISSPNVYFICYGR